jgi:hypothetical protein
MESLNEITKSFANNDAVYIIVGIALFFIAITIIRKIIAIASFVFIGLCIFALVKGGVLTSHEANTGSDGNSSYISQKVDAIKKTYIDSLDFLKNTRKKAENITEEALQEGKKISKQFEGGKEDKKSSEIEKILKNF